MSYGNGYYPPGTPGPSETDLTYRCANPDCGEHGYPVEVAAFTELGGTFLHDEDDVICHHCKREMKQAD